MPTSDFNFEDGDVMTAEEFAQAQLDPGRDEVEATAIDMERRGTELDHFTAINAGTQRLLMGVLAIVNHTLLPYHESFAPAELVELQRILREARLALKKNESELASGAAMLLDAARALKDRVRL